MYSRYWEGRNTNTNFALTVTHQFYKAGILEEYVIIGNDALLKCNIPSFVADFVRVVAWVSNDGETFSADDPSYGTYKYWMVP